MSTTFLNVASAHASADWPVLRTKVREAAAFGLFYSLAPLLGFTVLVVLFRVGVLSGVDILFYRGLVLIALAFMTTFALLFTAVRRFGRRKVRGRDAFSAAILSLALNLSFFVLFPVTVDRSISVFILGEMAAHDGQAYSADQMSQVFSTVYVGDYRQIDRRMREQALSGNVDKIGDAYRITPRGAAFIRTSKAVAWLFGADSRLVDPQAPPVLRPASTLAP